MLCQKCGRLAATIHKEDTVYRQKIEQHLCVFCAGHDPWSPPAEEGIIEVISYISDATSARRLRPPEFEPNGLAALAGYLTRLYAATHPFSLLAVYIADDVAIFVMGSRGSAVVSVPALKHFPATTLERDVREYFVRHNVPPHHLSARSPAHTHYQLPELPDDATRLVIGLLLVCFNVRERDPLKFRLTHYPKKGRQAE